MAEVKNKGCRASTVVLQEFSNTCAELGGATHRMQALSKVIPKMHTRLEELQTELDAAKRQEDARTQETIPEAVQ